jgi:hypothetical protein
MDAALAAMFAHIPIESLGGCVVAAALICAAQYRFRH